MNRQAWIAIVLAALAAVLAYYYISEKEAKLKADATPLQVMVAAGNIARGATLALDKLAIAEVPGAYIMPGAVAAPTREQVLAQWHRDFENQVAVVAIAKGEQILPNKLSRISPGFAGLVPEGKRVATFALDPAAAVAGQLVPGNRVDVLGTFPAPGGGLAATIVLAQHVAVASVAGLTAADKSSKSVVLAPPAGPVLVGLALWPEEASRLTLAEKEGSLKLVLRATGDETEEDVPSQSLGNLMKR